MKRTILLACFVACAGTQVQGQTPAYTFEPNLCSSWITGYGGSPVVEGWTVQFNEPARIFDLGVWDAGADGGYGGTPAIECDITLGVWDEDQNLLASVVIPEGDTAPMLNYFRYMPIPDIYVQAGDQLTFGRLMNLGDWWEGDPFEVYPYFEDDQPGFVLNPGITYVGYNRSVSSGGTLLYPQLQSTTHSPKGAGTMNFKYAIVPEPGASLLLMCGTMVILRRR